MKRNSHPVKVVEVKDYEGLYANSHPYKVEVEGGGGGEYSDFTGATEISAGEHGLVPAPKAGEQNKYLKGDGTWAEVSGGGGSGIPTDATFWGQSYDSVNNKVGGNLIFDAATTSHGENSIWSSDAGFIGLHFKANGGTPLSLSKSMMLVGNGVTISFNNSREIKATSSGYGFAGNTMKLGVSSGTNLPSAFGNRLTSVADPTDPQDAATKNYVDTAVASAGAATYTPSEFNNLWENA